MEDQKKPKLTKSYVDKKGVVRKFYDFSETEQAGICKLTMGYTHRTYNEQEEVTNEIPVVETHTNTIVDWHGLWRMLEKCEIESFKVEVKAEDHYLFKD
ncbi:MAG: hypothetical protein NC311_13925 [Muribaculaceae bacterium]|nr:hypothetical protein [Muribaculaceae bacterium]